MRAQLLGFVAAAFGVLAVWEALGLAGSITARVSALVAPLRRGREPATGERQRLTAVGALTALAAGWMLAGPLFAIALVTATPLAARRVFAAHAARTRAALVEAAPALARAIADSLAGGSSIRAAVAAAPTSATGPARHAFERMAHALALGEETERSLEQLRVAAGHHAYDAIVAAIMLQREAGGDLVGLLRRLAATLELDARVAADARAATAQARYSAGLVVCLPLLAAVLAELAAPGSVRTLLATPISTVMTATAVTLQLLAWLVIRRVSAPVA